MDGDSVKVKQADWMGNSCTSFPAWHTGSSILAQHCDFSLEWARGWHPSHECDAMRIFFFKYNRSNNELYGLDQKCLGKKNCTFLNPVKFLWLFCEFEKSSHLGFSSYPFYNWVKMKHAWNNWICMTFFIYGNANKPYLFSFRCVISAWRVRCEIINFWGRDREMRCMNYA